MKYAVFIGRFQPVHLGHLATMEEALKHADQLIICLGSCNVAPNPKNPFTAGWRAAMIRAAIRPELLSRIHFVRIRDYLYDDAKWVTEVQSKVYEITGHDSKVSLIGYHKDNSSYYLDLFPEWQFIHATPKHRVNATDVRNLIYADQGYAHLVPESVPGMLPSDCLEAIRAEHEHYEAYKKQWIGPYPPIFVTADSVVFQSNHVLVVTRRDLPGKGLFALPGGFLKSTETILDCAVRELKEETCLLFPERELRSRLCEVKVFDHPARSLRGRTITHAHFFQLEEKIIPRVCGADDALKATWMPVPDVYRNEERFFEDHHSIITSFTH